MKATQLKAVAAASIALLAVTAARAAENVTIAVGSLLDGSTMTMRTLTIAPGEVLGWHNHPTGAYTIVKTGTLTVEDGCGDVVVYPQGSAFFEPPGRVHRGKNLTDGEVTTAQMFIAPPGLPISVSTGQACGEPVSVSECMDDGWMVFTYPRSFANQGDCVRFVTAGK